jgi:hypothetical protein
VTGGGTPGAGSVFAGDPVDATTGRVLEIAPGQPLVTPGPDARPGTADDVVHPSIVGDIDLVVRAGTPPEDGTIPAPAALGGSLPVAVAGVRGAGTPLPFTVYLSDGAVTRDQPYGNRVAAPEADGIPVVVLVFADRDGDGVIGPVASDGGAEARALAELEPVGTGLAFFAGGVARGSVPVTAGGAASEGGIRLGLTALALTGDVDPTFLGGFVPAGPAIMTALPFLPERDPARLFTNDLGPLVGVEGTLNPRPRAAALPVPGGVPDLALPLDGSSPTVDAAIALAGRAVCARVFEADASAEPPSLTLGTAGARARADLRVRAVDLLGNPTEPSGTMAVRVSVAGPLALLPDLAADTTLTLSGAAGAPVSVVATGAGHGTLRVTIGGALCQPLAVEARPERNAGVADAEVGPACDFTTIAAAVSAAVDRNGDGRVTIEVGEGVFREAVAVLRAVELRGRGARRTIVDARGLGPALAVRHRAAVVRGLTASGGTTGVLLRADALVTDVEAWGNLGDGFGLASAGAAVIACVARDNGADGVALDAVGVVAQSESRLNAGDGIGVKRAGGALVSANVVTTNGDDGIKVEESPGVRIVDNTSVGNLERGILVDRANEATILDNRSAANDEDGLRLRRSTGVLVADNDFSDNGGFGIRLEEATGDFDALAGPQGPPGSNEVSGNASGALRID